MVDLRNRMDLVVENSNQVLVKDLLLLVGDGQKALVVWFSSSPERA